jgi:hypothetical protein
MRIINPIQLFASQRYAHGDMEHVLIDAQTNEPFKSYDDAAVAAQECGDTLFEFVFHELSDCAPEGHYTTSDARDEAVRRLHAAAQQLTELAREIEFVMEPRL